MKGRTRLVYVGALLLFIGCGIDYGNVKYKPKFLYKNPANNVKISGAIKKHSEDFIRETLGAMPKTVQDSVKEIVLYQSRSGCEFTEKEVGHCHYPEYKICILERKLSRTVIWHEAEHADYHRLGEAAWAQWKEIAGDVYGGTKGKKYPAEGVLDDYAAKNHFEDIAIWVECCYAHCDGMATPFKKIGDKNDPRYIKKLNFILEKKQITKEIYNEVLPLLK